MSTPELVVVADPHAVAAEAARRIAMALERAVDARGRADWATTGGSMAPPIYLQLAGTPLRDRVPWAAVHVWWGDDRFVPRDHPLSNVKPFDDILLAIGGGPRPVPLSLDHVHPFRTAEAIGAGRDAASCAAELAEELMTADLERDGDWPVFDLVVVGVGADGHVLSVFPGSAAFDADGLAIAIPAPTHIAPHVERVTLNPGVLATARQVLLVASGVEKAGIIRAALQDRISPSRLPVQLASGPNAVWVLDTAAAEELDATGGLNPPRPPSAPG